MNKSTEQTEGHVPWICLPQGDLPAEHSRYTHRSSALSVGGGSSWLSSIPVSDHWRLLDPPWGEGRQTSHQSTDASTPVNVG